METVHSLRKRGYKVRVLHNRVYEYRSDNTGKFDNYLTFLMTKELSAKGGSTVVELTKGQIHAKGEAICHPEDNYDKKEGVRIALGRALDELEQKFCKWTISIEYEYDGHFHAKSLAHTYEIMGRSDASMRGVIENAAEFLKGDIVN